MRVPLFLATLAAASAALAVDVGIFDNTRVLDPTWNCQNGGVMTNFSSVWGSKGAVWHQTPTLTSAFLSTVTVFYTGEINTVLFTADEQTAAMNWVKAGGTLVVTCDCPCESNQTAYDTLLNNFGINDSGADSPEAGSILGAHRVTAGLTVPQFGVHGKMTGPSDALNLINDVNGHLVGLVMQGTPVVGSGRLLVISDNDCFSDFYVGAYAEDLTFLTNVADWALRPYTISGHAILDNAAGSVAGVSVQLQLFGQSGLLEAFSGALDSNGVYTIPIDYSGAMDVLVKPQKWLAVRKHGVTVASATPLDIEFPYGGDVDNSNAVNLLDISIVLRDFGKSGTVQGDANLDGVVGLKDLSTVLKNYNKAGDS